MSVREELLKELVLVAGSGVVVSLTEICLIVATVDACRSDFFEELSPVEPAAFLLLASLYAVAALFAAVDLLRQKCCRFTVPTGSASAHLFGWWCPSIACAFAFACGGPTVGITCRVVGAVASTALVEWQTVRTGRVPVPTPGRIAVHLLVQLRGGR